MKETKPSEHDLGAWTYLSHAARPMTIAEIDSIVIKANAYNAMHQVTGVLLHHQATFFQYIEGPAAGVAAIMARVRAASVHRIREEPFEGAIPKRYFSQWYMASRQSGRDNLLQLGTARWTRAVNGLHSIEHSEGLRRLLAFWAEAEPAEPA